MLQRTPTEDLGIQVADQTPQATDVPGAVYHAPAPHGIGSNLAGGWFKLAGQAVNDINRTMQARAETQGTVDEFAGVTDSAERSNIFTRQSYEAGAAKQRSITALNDFQATAAQDMQPAAENNLTPDEYVKQQRDKLVSLISENGAALDDASYTQLVQQADSGLRSMGSAYTGFKTKYDKDLQEQGTNAVLGLEYRNLAAARSPSTYGPDGTPDTDGYMQAFQRGLTNLTSTRTPLNKDNLNKAVGSYIEEAAKNSTTDGVAGIKLMNQMYDSVTKNPSFGGMDPEQQQGAIKALETMRDQAAKEYMSELKQGIESAKEGAEMDVPVDSKGINDAVSNSEQLLRMGFITRTQHSQIIAAADAARVADYKRNKRAAETPASMEEVLTSAQANKAFKQSMQQWAASDPTSGAQGARMHALDETMLAAKRSGNLELQNVVSKEMGDVVQGWVNSPYDNNNKPTDADVGMMNMLRNAYDNAAAASSSDGTLGSTWGMLTGNLPPATRQVLEQTLATNKGQEVHMLMKSFLENSKRANDFQAANLSPSDVQAIMQAQPTSNPLWNRVKDKAGLMKDAVYGFLGGSSVGDTGEQQARVAAFQQPVWMAQNAQIVRDDPSKYNLQADKATAVRLDAARAIKQRSFSAPGVTYTAVVAPGVESAVPGIRGIIDERTGEPSEMFQAYVDQRISEFKAANPNHRGWLSLRIMPAGNAAVIEGSPIDQSQKDTVERLGIVDANSLSKFQDTYYKKVSVQREAEQMQKPIVYQSAAGTQGTLGLMGTNRAGVDGKTFINAQELALAMKPPATALPVNPLAVQQSTERAIGAADSAMKTLGVSRAIYGQPNALSPELERNYVSLFTAAEVAGGAGTAEKLAGIVKQVKADPKNVNEIRLVAEVRALFPRKISDADWNGKVIPNLKAVVNNVAYSMP